MSEACPLCHLTFPLSQLESHVNGHFEEDELGRDMELARNIELEEQIALASSSPRTLSSGDKTAKASEQLLGNAQCGEIHISEKIASLISCQIRSTFHRVQEGLMTLLRRSLEMESENRQSIITGHIDHYQSSRGEDLGWGCGWRNIQMMCSHLLMQRQDVNKVMFGGSGFVPDIPSLQRWLEIAWEMGFDMYGAESFNYKIYGSRKWIGTTECAALLRSFGLRAQIVDFGSKMGETSRSWGGQTANHIWGPMDKFLQKVPGASSDLFNHGNLKCYSTSCGNGLQILVDWVWNYFVDQSFFCSGNDHRVLVSRKTPLYFQHYGHSRTIVGIQSQRIGDGMPERRMLLDVDPGQNTATLERSLRENDGWQKLVKRGVHTLKKPQYQLCYVDPGVALGWELEQLKTIHRMCSST
ncbi:zinc finger with UFM1-specific peptidase domain protein [Amborella trichopoda]|uniref:UFSP1/2/DUB catalytic domain-containing protein n=1 Tax=Amborella trichopoda TaxID=13333 RepID=W1PKG5_AMBTC|nr:zinc finger with UFM1-specific peptidase domain protein [Amborella trichopoda]ERN08204.1 hypothetical protein AMTR_s00018p00193580 [Amborella trichopoda]|eukprot:XP_006846529.1 zinc finger with UFM1-specific peptidase domain protein [Amborella trichopoda]